MPMTDSEKMIQDAAIYGTGMMLDGVHVPLKEIYQGDRELLELAARAHWGDEIDDVVSIRWSEADEAILYTHADNQDHNGQDCERVWNPLTQDHDALRLAVKLQLTVANEHVRAGVAYCTDGDDNEYPAVRSGANQGEVIEEDYAATRRAIVMAAAQLGKAIR